MKKKLYIKNFSPLSPVSLTPLINIHLRLSPRIFEKIWNDNNVILMGPGDTDLWKKTWCQKSRFRLPVRHLVEKISFCCFYIVIIEIHSKVWLNESTHPPRISFTKTKYCGVRIIWISPLWSYVTKTFAARMCCCCDGMWLRHFLARTFCGWDVVWLGNIWWRYI